MHSRTRKSQTNRRQIEHKLRHLTIRNKPRKRLEDNGGQCATLGASKVVLSHYFIQLTSVYVRKKKLSDVDVATTGSSTISCFDQNTFSPFFFSLTSTVQFIVYIDANDRTIESDTTDTTDTTCCHICRHALLMRSH